MLAAAEALTTDKAVALYEKFGIFTRPELESRKEIVYDYYAKTINIEALTMIDMAGRQIIPACMHYEKELAETVVAVHGAGADTTTEERRLAQVAAHINEAQSALEALTAAAGKAQGIGDVHEKALFYRDKIVPLMQDLRTPCDQMEVLVDRSMWPFPTYQDLMFEV